MMILVPARAGSKRLPGKNTALFRGAPLVMWSLAAARYLAELIGPQAQVVLSSDAPEIMALGAPLDGVALRRRPPSLAGDEIAMDEVALDAADWLAAQSPPASSPAPARYILLQPTSPLRLTEDLERLAALPGTRVSCTHPAEAAKDMIDIAAQGQPVLTAPDPLTAPAPLTAPTQDAANQKRAASMRFIDGSYYAGELADLRAGRGFTPAGQTGFETLALPRANDIDTALDWAMAEALHDYLCAKEMRFVRP